MLARTVAVRMLTLLMAGGVAAGCTPKDNENATANADTAMEQAAPPPAAQPAAPNDAQIADIVMIANTADSAGGELALKKSSDEQVKAFARRMIQDHGAANQQAAQIAQQAALTPAESDMGRQIKMAADSTSQALQAMSGADFDRAYVAHEVQMHQQVLDALDQQLIPNAQNPQLKDLLQKVRPTIDSHLQQIQQIQAKLANPTTKPKT